MGHFLNKIVNFLIKIIYLWYRNHMSYKITEDGNIATVHLDGEIDMDVTE